MRLYSTRDAAAELDVPARVIYQWRHRELIEPDGLLPGRGKPVPLYRLDQLRPLAERYLRRATRRGRGR